VVHVEQVTLPLLLATLVGAIIWNVITWLLGLPTSSSHALIGGLIGAASPPPDLPWFLGRSIKNISFYIIAPVWVFWRHDFHHHDHLDFPKVDPVKIKPYIKKCNCLGHVRQHRHGTNDAQKQWG